MPGRPSSTTFFTFNEKVSTFHNSLTIGPGFCEKIFICMISKDVYIKMSLLKMFTKRLRKVESSQLKRIR